MKQLHLQKAPWRKISRGWKTGSCAHCYCLKCLLLLDVYLPLINLRDGVSEDNLMLVFVEIRACKLETEVQCSGSLLQRAVTATIREVTQIYKPFKCG